MVVDILTKLGVGIFAGISFALTGYAKNAGEPFDPYGFCSTISMGAFAGLVNIAAGIPLDSAEGVAIVIGIPVFVTNILKAIVRRIRGTNTTTWYR